MPDPKLGPCYIYHLQKHRLFNLFRGVLVLHKKAFIGRNVRIICKNNIDFGYFCSIEDHVSINAIALEKLTIGDNIKIGAYSKIMCTAHMSKMGKGFQIGDNSACGEFCYFGAAGGIKIGAQVIMGQYVSMHAQEHIFDNVELPIMQQGTTESGITVEDDCWIGAKATLLDGTYIGKHSVIAAGSVVKGHFPAYSVIAGVPAKVVRSLA